MPENVVREFPHLFHQNVTIMEGPACTLDGSSDTNDLCMKGTDINKWVIADVYLKHFLNKFNLMKAAGSPLAVSQLSRHYLVGLVSHYILDSCSKASRITKIAEAIRWITAVCTEAVPVRTVS